MPTDIPLHRILMQCSMPVDVVHVPALVRVLVVVLVRLRLTSIN